MATKADCTCPDPDGGEFDIDCPDHVVFYLGTDAELAEAEAAQRRYDAENAHHA